MEEGYIKILRKIGEWEWYKDSQTFHFFIHLILKANFKPSRFMGYDIPRGSLVCGRKQLSEDTGISEQSIRTILERLKSTNEITIKSTNKFSIITVCNYDIYQSDFKKSTNTSTSKSTNDQPTTNQQLTTSEEVKKLRSKEEEYGEPSLFPEEPAEPKNSKNKIIPPFPEWVTEYCRNRKNNVDPQRFMDYYDSKGWMIGKNKMKDWQAAVRTWEKNIGLTVSNSTIPQEDDVRKRREALLTGAHL